MARIRTIKPEFWQDEKIGELSPLARLMFIACWNLADDEGLLKLNPAYLKAQVFPYDEISLEDSKNILGELTEKKFIFPYKDAKNQEYGWIVNFRKHQRIDKPQAPKLPVPSIQNPAVKQMYAFRDDFKCHICGGEISITEDDKSLILSLDHLKPRAMGGDDRPSNIMCAHFGCNASKKDFGDDSWKVLGTIPGGKERKGKEQGEGRARAREASPDGLMAVLPEDWELPDDWRREGEAVLVKCGAAPGTVNIEAEAIAFHGHYRSEQKASGDFRALWRKWLVGAVARARKDAGRLSRGGPAERPPSKPFPFLPDSQPRKRGGDA